MSIENRFRSFFHIGTFSHVCDGAAVGVKNTSRFFLVVNPLVCFLLTRSAVHPLCQYAQNGRQPPGLFLQETNFHQLKFQWPSRKWVLVLLMSNTWLLLNFGVSGTPCCPLSMHVIYQFWVKRSTMLTIFIKGVMKFPMLVHHVGLIPCLLLINFGISCTP